ncbi:hypothetical protein LX87_05206 [Larkinella arboricola]|uniref:Uncharacterized protein n=1 Tax=Larkinella arboricola TaxID=643671 RepID=A0A327WN31_LARAB|nr:hypothetical protein LX87_05206 [Larkinella arboricola]
MNKAAALSKFEKIVGVNLTDQLAGQPSPAAFYTCKVIHSYNF